MNSVLVGVEILLAVCTVVAGVFGVTKLVYRRGGDEREWVTAVHDNTAAQKELAIGLRDFKDYTVTSLHDLAISHEKLAGDVAVIKEQLKKVT
jgi:hypothetical protein